MNLLRLHAFTGEERYRRRADEVIAAFSAVAEKAAPAFPRLLCALDFASDGAREIVLSGTAGDADFESLRSEVFASPRLNRVLAHASADTPSELASLAEGADLGLGAGLRLRELRVPRSRDGSRGARGGAS